MTETPRTTFSQEAILQTYSTELLNVLEEMRHKRDVVNKQILNETRLKDKLQTNLRTLSENLAKRNESIVDKIITRNRLDETIMKTEDEFNKLIAGSQDMIKFMKKFNATVLPEITSQQEIEETEVESVEERNKSWQK